EFTRGGQLEQLLPAVNRFIDEIKAKAASLSVRDPSLPAEPEPERPPSPIGTPRPTPSDIAAEAINRQGASRRQPTEDFGVVNLSSVPWQHRSLDPVTEQAS